jgi:radical SAM protein with 4Fe4S-binding SPASM domain
MVFALEDPVCDEKIVISVEQETSVEAKRNPLIKSSRSKRLIQKIRSKLERDGLVGVLSGIRANAHLNLKHMLVRKIPRFIPYIVRKPHVVFIETTNACNLRCEMCFRGKRESGFIDFELFKKAVDEVAAIGDACLVLHFGGETTLHPRFPDMIRYVMARRKRFYNVGFFTNGMLLSKSLSEVIVESQVDWIAVSIDGVGELNNRIRRGSNYGVIKKNLETLLQVRGKRKKPLITTNTTMTVQTDSELEEIKAEWIGKVDGMNFSGCIDSTYKYTNLDRYKRLNPQGVKENVPPTCNMLFDLLAVLYNGDITFCCHNINGDYPLGNLHETSLKEAWRSKHFMDLRKSVIAEQPLENTLCFFCEKYPWKNRTDGVSFSVEQIDLRNRAQ